MNNYALDKNIKAIQAFYPMAEPNPHAIRIESISGLPVWMKGAVKVYELPMLGIPSAPLYLAIPTGNLEVEHLIRIYKQLADTLQRHILIVADHLPPKHRPLLVKFRIPFIYKDETIFAPELGLKFDKLKAYQTQERIEVKAKNTPLAPFALKVVAGILTNKIPHEFTLKTLHEQIKKAGHKLSNSKLGATLNELNANQLIRAHGRGPQKTYQCEEPKKTWNFLNERVIAPFFREVQVNYIPKSIEAYTIAGERALAHYSNLGSPKNTTIAMTAGQYRDVFQIQKDTKPYGDFGDPITVQIWKEDPRIFAVDEALNPIELYFSLRTHHDERIQIALDELLSPYGLERK